MKSKNKILKASAEKDELFLSCPITFDQSTLEATAAGEKPKTPTFEMQANTGVPMKVEGFEDKLIVSLAGAKFAKVKTPIIMDHDVKARIGHSTEQSIDVKANSIPVKGIVSSRTQTAQDFVADAKEGFPFQASISGPIHDLTFVPAGKSMKVNGKEWKGPLNVVNSMTIREISVTVLGADGNTETRVAASLRKPAMNEFETWVAGLGLTLADLSEDTTTKLKAQHQAILDAAKTDKKTKKVKASDPKDDDDDDDDNDDPALRLQRSRELIAADEERVGALTLIATQYTDRFPEKMEYTHSDGKKTEYKTLSGFKAAAIRYNMTPDQFELQLMRCSRADKTNQPGVYSHNGELENQVMEARLCREFSMQSSKSHWQAKWTQDPFAKGEVPANCRGRDFGIEAYYKPEILEKSHDKKYDGCSSIQALLDMQIRAAGRGYHGMSRNSNDFMAAAVDAWTTVRASGFSTLNVPNILENIMHKFALAAFDSQEQTWRIFTARKSLSDFRPHNMYRLNWQGHFRQVDQQGQLKHVSMVDSKYSVAANTFGAMITIDRKTIRNDDLGQIIAKATAIGMLGALRIEQNVYTLLLSNPGSFFSSTLGNYISGSSSALNQTGASTPATPAGLDYARRQFRNQVINGYPIGISPRYILGGTSMETQMYQMWRQETFAVAGVSGSISWNLNANEFQGLYRPIVSPYLNNTSLTDDNGNAISGQSNTQWYLFTEPNLPQGGAIVIGFLDGRDQPFFDQADTQFNIPGGIQFRAYLDWGVAMNVYQLALLSAGT